VALPPLNLAPARSLMEETRIYRLLEGYRDRPAADIDAIALALVNLSQLAADFAEVAEVDVKPLLADSQGAIARGARGRGRRRSEVRQGRRPDSRLGFRPYPKRAEQSGRLRHGTRSRSRPSRPEDEPALQRPFEHLTPGDVR